MRSNRRSPALQPGVAEENVQARVRGTILMALSNKFGWLVVATGNKSEYSVGYATLYGDMAGGFALLKDVYKTDVFRLARHLNERAGRELIPQSVIDRPPSAELRAEQRDEDSLPPYAKLDRVLEAYVELDLSREELSAATASTPTSSSGRWRSSTGPSTSAARRRRGSSFGRRRSAATGGCRSRTAGRASGRRASADVESTSVSYKVTITFLVEAESEEILERYVDRLAYDVASERTSCSTTARSWRSTCRSPGAIGRSPKRICRTPAGEAVELDVEGVRARFSALDRPLALLDAPGGTQVPDSVIEAMASYLRQSNANLGGAFETSRAQRARRRPRRTWPPPPSSAARPRRSASART